MMKKITIGQLCKPNIGQIKLDDDRLIDYFDIASIDNINKKITGFTTYTFVEAPSRARRMIKKDNILVSTIRPNLNAVALFDMNTQNIPVASTGFCVLDCKEDTNPRFLFYYLQSRFFVNEMVSQATGASYPAVSDKIVRSAHIPVYSYDEQVVIADMLDKVTYIIAKRKQQLAKLDELVKARFVEMFGDMLLNPMAWPEVVLETLADIVSGITKGRKVREQTLLEVPYMAVSNVKDGYIDWTTVKTILATEREIEQYCLFPDDVLMTEGGDPDKVGRGAIIKEPLENCIHQNHIFRVRLDKGKILPTFFTEYLQHQKAKRYFLGCAKQTTGIASINMKQLKALAVLLPPLDLQQKFDEFVRQVELVSCSIQNYLEQMETLKKALMQQYFG